MHTNWFFFGLLALACGYALWRGGAPERAVATMFAVGAVASHLAVQSHVPHIYRGVEYGVLFVDGVLLAFFLAVAVRAERLWPLAFTAFHLLGFLGHFLRIANPHFDAYEYYFSVAAPSYPMILLLTWGTRDHASRLARNGCDPAWSAPLSPRVKS